MNPPLRLSESLRVDPKSASVRHDPLLMPEVSVDPNSSPDLFNVLPSFTKHAFELGLLSKDPGFHVFVEVADDVDVLDTLLMHANRILQSKTPQRDVVYLHNFDAPSEPRCVILPPGEGPELAQAMAMCIENIRARLAMMEYDQEVRSARAKLAKALKERQRNVLSELESFAKKLGFGIKNVPGGVQTFPILHGKPVSAEQFEILDESTKKSLTEAEERLAEAIDEAAARIQQSTQEVDAASEVFEDKLLRSLLETETKTIYDRFAYIPEILEYLDRVVDELMLSIDDLAIAFNMPLKANQNEPYDRNASLEAEARLSRFSVNVFVTSASKIQSSVLEDSNPIPTDVSALLNEILSPTPNEHAADEDTSISIPPVSVRKIPSKKPPTSVSTARSNRLQNVIFEADPTRENLFGSVEYSLRSGVAAADSTNIRPGVVHKASEGVLILRVRDLLIDPWIWEQLKRVLRTQKSAPETPRLSSTVIVPLRPEPCPITTKVVLIGSHELYTQLLDADPDFASLFRVKVEVMPTLQRSIESSHALDAYLVHFAQIRAWGILDLSARARLLDYACRLAEDSRRFALCLHPLEEILAFASMRAKEQTMPSINHDNLPTITALDLDYAWEQRRERTAGAEHELRKMILQNEVLIATDGVRVGVVNGLSVLSAGDVQFGHPIRITAVVSLGHEGLIDVEREAALGGSLHTKGVAILRGFLSGTFGQERPVALRAQIAFEQSYGEVEGDSASSSELYAILSALADVPIDQSIAVTGSVNQFGEVQTIGGVTAKIEGFFDLCAARGFTGRQGVVIPKSCVQHLTLRDDVVNAIRDGKFTLFAVEHVTQGIEILTGIRAGDRDTNGRFPAESIFGRVERRLIEIAERMRRAENGERAVNTTDVLTEESEASC